FGVQIFKPYESRNRSTTSRCEFRLLNTASAKTERSPGFEQSPFWSTPSSTRRRWISFEQSLDTGMLVGASTEHPAPSTKAILPPPGEETACNNSGGRAMITPLKFLRCSPHR